MISIWAGSDELNIYRLNGKGKTSGSSTTSLDTDIGGNRTLLVPLSNMIVRFELEIGVVRPLIKRPGNASRDSN